MRRGGGFKVQAGHRGRVKLALFTALQRIVGKGGEKTRTGEERRDGIGILLACQRYGPASVHCIYTIVRRLTRGLGHCPEGELMG